MCLFVCLCVQGAFVCVCLGFGQEKRLGKDRDVKRGEQAARRQHRTGRTTCSSVRISPPQPQHSPAFTPRRKLRGSDETRFHAHRSTQTKKPNSHTAPTASITSQVAAALVSRPKARQAWGNSIGGIVVVVCGNVWGTNITIDLLSQLFVC